VRPRDRNKQAKRGRERERDRERQRERGREREHEEEKEKKRTRKKKRRERERRSVLFKNTKNLISSGRRIYLHIQSVFEVPRISQMCKYMEAHRNNGGNVLDAHQDDIRSHPIYRYRYR
jgi:hypothetical protein